MATRAFHLKQLCSRCLVQACVSPVPAVFDHSGSEHVSVGSFSCPETAVAVDSYPSWHFTGQARQ